METTPPPRVVETSSGPDAPAGQSAAFADVVHAWHARGEPVPVAVVASVFDDVLAGSVQDDGRASLQLEDLRVTPGGAAYLTRPAQLSAVCPLLMEAMGADLLGDQAVPPAAWALFDKLTSDEPSDHPADAEQLRQWLRETLGTPATHEEVRDCVFHALMGGGEAPESALEVPEAADDDDDVHELETLPPHSAAPLPVPDPAAEAAVATLPPEREAHDHQLSTDVVRERAVPRDRQPRTDVERATHLPEPLPDSLEPGPETALPTTVDEGPPSAVHAARAEADAPEAALPPDAPEPEAPETAMPMPLESELDAASAQPTERADTPSRPVVRHELPRGPRPVSVVTAPAARRSARSSPHGGDSILVPADQKRGWVWVGVVAAICAAVYFLFFR